MGADGKREGAEHKPLSEDVGHLWNGEGQWDSGEESCTCFRRLGSIYLEQGGTCRLKTKELTKLGRYYEGQ